MTDIPQIRLLKVLFSFRGRHNRAKFWLITFVVFLWMMVAAALIYAAEAETYDVAMVLAGLCGVVVGLWVTFANYVKRLHDFNASGWWSILAIGIAPVLTESGDYVGPGAANILAGVGMLIGFMTLAIFGGLEGTAGDNRFGPDPLQRSDESTQVTAVPGSRDIG